MSARIFPDFFHFFLSIRDIGEGLFLNILRILFFRLSCKKSKIYN